MFCGHIFPVFNTIPCKEKIFRNTCYETEGLNYIAYLDILSKPGLDLVFANRLFFHKSKKMYWSKPHWCCHRQVMETWTGRVVVRQKRMEKTVTSNGFLTNPKAVSADSSPGLPPLEISSTEGNKEGTNTLTKSADTAKLRRVVGQKQFKIILTNYWKI